MMPKCYGQVAGRCHRENVQPIAEAKKTAQRKPLEVDWEHPDPSWGGRRYRVDGVPCDLRTAVRACGCEPREITSRLNEAQKSGRGGAWIGPHRVERK